MSIFTLAFLVAIGLYVLRPEVRDRLFFAARIVVRIERGTARVTRGHLPGSLLDDLRYIAEDHPTLSGKVNLYGKGPDLRIDVRGLPEGPAQRVRNVVNLRRRDI